MSAVRPTVSVLMSVRNGRSFLEEALESLRAQTWENFELLVTDDGSDDGSTELLARTAENDTRVRVFFNREARGLTRALEAMTREARGEFIARMDADDRSHPRRLEIQVARMRRDARLGVLGSWFRRIAADGAWIDELRYPDEHRWIRERLLAGQNVLCHGSLLIRRAVLEQLGTPVWRFRFGQDYDLHLRLIDRTRYGYVEEVLYDWRTHDASMSASIAQRRAHLNRLMLELYRTRDRGLPEGDWLAAEESVLAELEAFKTRSAAGWENYARGRRALAEGRLEEARRLLAQARNCTAVARRAALMSALAHLPFDVGSRALRVSDRIRAWRDPRSRYIMKRGGQI